MQSKHKIIGLTSLILTTTTSIVYSESIKHTDNAQYHATSSVSLGPHSEGGESGEGGFHAKTLKTDDIAFGTALEVIHAHYLIGEKLYKAGDYESAESFFGHPISEVLVDLEPAFKFRNIESPEDEMYALLEVAQQKDKLSDLQAGIKKVLLKIENAFERIKIADKTHQIHNIAMINADLIRRSKLEYFQAIDNNELGALQDSIGYFEAAYYLFKKNTKQYQSLNSDKTDKLSTLLDEIKPVFANFQEINQKINHKKIAGLMAKIELSLANL